MRQSAVILLLSALFAVSLSAATPPPRSSFEQILLPIVLFQYVPGALGTLWATEFTGFNAGAEDTDAFQTQCAYYCTCNANPCQPGFAVPPGSQFSVVPKHDVNGRNLGVFIYVAKSHASDIAYSLRIREVVRGTTPAQLPVVHERDFRTGDTFLPSVPVDAASRTRLRIYGISSPGGAGVLRVRIIPWDGTAETDLVVSLTPPNSGSRLAAADEFPEQPAYVDVGDLNPLVKGNMNVRLAIESLTPGLVYWPLVTVTNNQTQQLMTVAPQ